MFKTNPENASVVTRLTAMLEELSIGGTIEYGTLSSAVDRELDGKHRYLLDSARDAGEEKLGCIFEAVHGVGIKRLPSDECPSIGLTAIRSIRRRAKRGVKRLTRLGANSMSESANRQAISSRSMLGAIAQIADI